MDHLVYDDRCIDIPLPTTYYVRREGEKDSASGIFTDVREACDKAKEIAGRYNKTTFIMRDAMIVSRIYVFHPGEDEPCPNRDHDW